MAELKRVLDGPDHKELRRLILDAVQEDRDRTSARLVQERDRQRAAEAAKSACLCELRLAREAAEAEAKRKAGFREARVARKHVRRMGKILQCVRLATRMVGALRSDLGGFRWKNGRSSRQMLPLARR